MKIITVVGARPQFIKLAPLSKEIRKYFKEVIVHTGQHYNDNMSKIFFEDLDLPLPDYNLQVGSGNHSQQTGLMLTKIEEVFLAEKPDLCIVFGDTNSTLAGALVAAKMEISLIHVESGLRSFNRSMPEEINRVLTDHCSNHLFAPTEIAMQNLKNEGLTDQAFLTGDIMLDSLTININKIKQSRKIYSVLNIYDQKYILLTLHRPYNVDNKEKLQRIFHVLSESNYKIIFPVHPRTKKMIDNFSIEIGENILIIEPVGYLDFIALESNAFKIITDSGGIQKEAYILEKPCITVRPETEWIETVETGWNTLVGFNSEKLRSAIKTIYTPKSHPDIFGEFSCTKKMMDIIKNIKN